MKKNKKYSIWGFLVVLTFVCFIPKIYAEDNTYKINLSSDNMNPEVGDTFTVLSSLSTSLDTTCKVSLTYDATKLELVSVKNTDNFTREPLSFNITTKELQAISKINFKAINGGTSTIKVSEVSCGTGDYTGDLSSVDINVKSIELSTLTLSNGKLSPAFNPSTTEYSATIDTEKTTISATCVDGLTISGVGEQTLNVGEEKTVKVTVTSKNGSKKTYSIKLTRKEEEKKSDNRYLKSITFNEETIQVTDEKSTYTLNVKNNVESVDLKYELESDKASAEVKGPEKLEVGVNTFVITVTAEDGSTKEYKLLVTRQDEKNVIDNDSEKILEEIENGEDKYIYVGINQDEEEKIIDKSILKDLKKYEKTAVYEITNENGDILYSLTLNGKDVKQENVDLNMQMSFKSDNKAKIISLAKTSKLVYLNFEKKAKLPLSVTMKVFVGDKFKNKDSLYLYLYNEKTNKLEKTLKNIIVKNGYVEFVLEKTDEYVLSSIDLDSTEEPKENNNIMIYIIIGGALLLVIIVVVVIIIIKKKKNKNPDKPKKEKKKKETKTKEKTEESNPELEKTLVLDNSELNPSVIAQAPSVVVPEENLENNETTENNEIQNPETEEKTVENHVENTINEDTPQTPNQGDVKEETTDNNQSNTEDEEEIEIIDDLKG